MEVVRAEVTPRPAESYENTLLRLPFSQALLPMVIENFPSATEDIGRITLASDPKGDFKKIVSIDSFDPSTGKVQDVRQEALIRLKELADKDQTVRLMQLYSEPFYVTYKDHTLQVNIGWLPTNPTNEQKKAMKAVGEWRESLRAYKETPTEKKTGILGFFIKNKKS